MGSADAWDLTHFIQSLSPGYAKNMSVVADRATGAAQ
jgi:hypothetical protein